MYNDYSTGVIAKDVPMNAENILLVKRRIREALCRVMRTYAEMGWDNWKPVNYESPAVNTAINKCVDLILKHELGPKSYMKAEEESFGQYCDETALWDLLYNYENVENEFVYCFIEDFKNKLNSCPDAYVKNASGR